MKEPADLAATYRRALASWLSGAGESALSEAYELGRQLLAGGVGLLGLADLHQRSVREWLAAYQAGVGKSAAICHELYERLPQHGWEAARGEPLMLELLSVLQVLGPDPDDERVDEVVLQRVAAFGGSIAAEHGIGVAKTRWLGLTRSEEEIELMRALKTALDPSGILGRGRVLPADGAT